MLYSVITALITALVLILCFFAYKKYQERKEDSSNIANEHKGFKAQSQNDNGTNEYLGMNTRELCIKVLEKLNCQPELYNEAIYFTFQGEHFIVTIPENGVWIRVFDRTWIESSLDNLDDVCNIRTAVNTVNVYLGVTLVFQIDQENKNITVSTWGQFLLVPQIPNIEAYMFSLFSYFFEAHRRFLYEYDKLKKNETSTNNQSA